MCVSKSINKFSRNKSYNIGSYLVCYHFSFQYNHYWNKCYRKWHKILGACTMLYLLSANWYRHVWDICIIYSLFLPNFFLARCTSFFIRYISRPFLVHYLYKFPFISLLFVFCIKGMSNRKCIQSEMVNIIKDDIVC